MPATIRTLVVRIGADAKDIQTAFAKIGADAKDLQGSLAKVGQLPSGADATASFDRLKKNIDEVIKSQEKLGREGQNVANGILAMGGPARLTSTQLDELARAVNRGLDAFRALGKEAPAELQKVARAIQQQQQQLSQTRASGSPFGPLGSLIPSIGTGVGLAGAFTVAAKQALDYADALEKLRDRTGITEDALQRLDAVARPSGNTLEQVATAVNRFQNNLETGNKGALDAIGRLGLSVSELKALSPDEQFLAIARAIQTIRNPAEQTAAAIALFGRGGVEILPTLKAKVDELADSTFRLSNESARTLDDLGDSFGRLKVDAVNAVGEIIAKLTQLEQRFPGLLGTGGLIGGIGAIGAGLGSRAVSALPPPTLPTVGQLSPTIGRGGLVGDIFTNIPTFGPTPQVSAQQSAAIAQVTAALHAQQAAADLLGLSLEDYQKKLEAANKHAQELAQGTSNLTFRQKQQILSFDTLGLSVEEISVKLGISQTAIRAYLDEFKHLGETMAANSVATGKTQKDIGNLAVGFNAAGRAVVGFRGLLRAEVGGLQVFAEGLESIVVQLQRLGQFNAAGLAQLGGVLSQSLSGSLPSVQLAGLGTLPNVSPQNTRLIHDALNTTVQWHDELRSLSAALSDLAQVSDGAFGEIVRSIGSVVSALDVVNQGLRTFQTSTSATGRLAGLAAAAAGFLQATNTGNRATSVLGGVATGAQIGSLFGPTGTAVGAGVGGLIGFIRSQDDDRAHELARQIGARLGLDLSDAFGAQLEADAARFGTHIAELLHFDQILAEHPERLRGTHLEGTIAEISGLFAPGTTSRVGIEQIGVVFERIFTQILPHAVNTFTGLATEQFQNLIRLAREFGVESEALTSFVNAQVSDNILGGINAFITANERLNRTILRQSGIVGTLGIASQEAASAIGSSLFVAFQELVANGATWLQALQQILPSFERLDAILRRTGFSGGEAFESLRPMFALIKDPAVAAAIEEIGGLQQILAGLANLDRLNPALLGGIGNQIGSIVDTLIASGKDRDTILQLIAPALQQLFELQQRNPTAVFDERTTTLLNEAIAKGLVGDQFKSAQERTIDAIKRTNQILEAIAAHSGVPLPSPRPVPTPAPGTGPPGSPTNPLPPPPPEPPEPPGGNVPGPTSFGRVLPFVARLPTETTFALDAQLQQEMRESFATAVGQVRPIYVDQRNSFFLDKESARKIADGVRSEIETGGVSPTAWQRVTKRRG